MAQNTWFSLQDRLKQLQQPEFYPEPGEVQPEISAEPVAAPAEETSAITDALDMYNTLKDAKGARAEQKYQTQDSSKKGINYKTLRNPNAVRGLRAQAQGLYFPQIGQDANGDPIFDFSAQPEVAAEDPYQKQEADLNKLQALFQSRMAGASNGINLKPLAALADMRNAEMGIQSNLAAAMPAHENKKDALLKFADDIAKRRADLLKSLPQGIKAMEGGTSLDQLAQIVTKSQMAGYGGPQSSRAEIAEQQRAWRTHQNVMDKLDKDKILQGQLQSYFGLDNALATVAKTSHITPNGLVEAQRAIMAGMQMSRGGTTGVSERGEMYLNTLPINVGERVMQWLTGDPASISPSDPIVKHIQELARIEQDNIKENFVSHMDTIAPGADWMYSQPRFSGEDPTTNYRGSLYKKYEAMKSQFNNKNQTKSSPQISPKTTPAKGSDRAAKLKEYQDLQKKLSDMGVK